jgi:hypothetical protein
MNAQGIRGRRRQTSVATLVLVALLALICAAAACAKTVPPKGSRSCGAGARTVVRVVRRHGRTTVVRTCRRKAPTGAPVASPAPESPAPAPPAATSPSTPPTGTATPADSGTLPGLLAEPPLAEAPATEPGSGGSGGGTGSEEPAEGSESEEGEAEEGEAEEPPASAAATVHAAIRTGFEQNPLVPDEVTWHYSASATKAVKLADGTVKSEAAPLPAGELAFFVDGKLECEIHVVGAIAGSACTVDLTRLGAHEVEAIFSNTETSDVASRTDLIARYPTTTSLQVSIEPVAPEYLDIGPNAYGFEQYAFEVGRVRISGATTPGFVPVFDCAGQGVGCIEPEVGLNRNGTASLPLYAQHRLNMKTGNEEWHVGFPAYSPSLRESNWFWQFPEESVGTEFFHAVGEPNRSLYEPSSATVPLDLNGGHYPFYRQVKVGEGASVTAVEGTMTHALTLGTYEKVDGAETVLKFSGRFYNNTGEAEDCRYQPRVDGVGLNEHRDADQGWFEVLNGFYNLPPGPHTFELWVERKAGSGTGSCGIESGYLEAYEKIH